MLISKLNTSKINEGEIVGFSLNCTSELSFTCRKCWVSLSALHRRDWVCDWQNWDHIEETPCLHFPHIFFYLRTPAGDQTRANPNEAGENITKTLYFFLGEMVLGSRQLCCFKLCVHEFSLKTENYNNQSTRSKSWVWCTSLLSRGSHQLSPPGRSGLPGWAETHSPAHVAADAAAERGQRPGAAGPAR